MDSQADEQVCIDKYICDKLTIYIYTYTMASAAACVSAKHFKPKSYWCTERSDLRNKKDSGGDGGVKMVGEDQVTYWIAIKV